MGSPGRAPLPTLPASDEDRRRVTETIRRLSDDLLKNTGVLRRTVVGKVVRALDPAFPVISLTWDQQNRVSLVSNTFCRLPRLDAAHVGAPLYFTKLSPIGSLTLAPSGLALDGSRAPTVNGLPALDVADAGLYCLMNDGTDWSISSVGSLYRFNVQFWGASPLASAAVNNAAFQAAYDAARAQGGGVVFIPDGRYALLGDIRMYANTWTEMSPATVLDISAAGAVDCLIADGSEDAALALTANAAKGATTLTMSAPNAATLSPQCWIRVASDTVFDASDTNSEIGEIVQVKTVSGTTVTLETPLRGGAYTTAASAFASRITFVENIRVTGGRIVGGGTVTTVGSDADCNGVRIFLGFRCFVDGTAFERCDLSGVWFQDSLFCQTIRCHFQDAVNDNQGYGVLWDNACQDCAAIDCTSDRVRHIVTCGNSTNTKGITRRIRYVGLQVYSTTPARGGSGGDAIDTHAAAEDILISCCTVYSSSGGGINVECASAQISDCQIFSTTDYGIIYHNESDQEGEISITGCRCVGTGVGGTWEAIRVNMPTRGSAAINKSVRVVGNEVEGCTGIGIYVVNSVSATQMRNVVVNDNAVAACGSTSASIYLEDCYGATVSGNSVREPTVLNQQAIQLRDCRNVSVTGNVVQHATSSTGVGIYVNAGTTGSCANISIQGNVIGCVTPSNLRGVVLDNTAQNCIIGKNTTVDCTTAYVRGTGTGHDVVDDLFTSALGIVSGAITVNRNWADVPVDTEGLAATDDLDTINGGNRGQIVVIRENSSARVVTVRHIGGGTGNIILTGAANFTFVSSNSTVALQWGGTFWREVGRCA